jgi:glycosidase
MRRDGFVSPNNPPTWIDGAMIYEAQIGFSVFNEVNKYSPYPTAADLVADLDRISGLGFTCIQLMPKQPYPSYNIHDYWDIDTSYGNKEDIKNLVIQAHKLNIKVILDILLHGVLDQEIIKLAADTVRSGPYAHLITSETGDNFSADVNDSHNYFIAWSRHIIDFENYWFEGSPPVSALIAEHPDWFYRNSDGQVQGVYTKAFDARNIEWQDYFISACKFLMTELSVDGFRFDAPSYNNFPNWSGWARGRAGASALGCLGLFDRLRPIMKSINSESLLYTEPSGHVWRQAMDLNYNYDEQWLVSALCDPSVQTAWGVRTAKQIAEWLFERDRFLPLGSMTAHHIDSHDTFWWPTWGNKWRREQFGIKKVNLLTLLFGALPGPFMMFCGGEIGIEQLLPQLAKVKKSKAWLEGEITWSISDQFPKDVFGITRTYGEEALFTVINFSDSEISIQHEYKFKTCSAVVEIGDAVRCLPDSFVIPALSGSILKLEKK